MAFDPVMLQTLDMIEPQKQARKLPRISPLVKWMLIRRAAYSSRRKIHG
jgi:hypothetical protein